MADLPTLAQRLNDIEISASAPLTETLMRRFGSNINFILDFLGVSNGASAPSGDLQDLSNAISTVSGHTMTLQYTSTGAGGGVSETIGTFNSIKYVNQIIIATASGGLSDSYGPAGSGSRWFVTKRANGTGPRTLPRARVDLTSPAFYDASSQILDNSIFTGPNGGLSGGVAGGTDGNIGAVASDLRVTDAQEWFQVAELDWREANSWLLEAHFANTPQATQFYLAYRLNVGSAGLIF